MVVNVLESEYDGDGGGGNDRDLRHDGVHQTRRGDVVILKSNY